MYALDVAIQTFWTANATALASIVGGISPDLQPPGTLTPYVVTYQPPAQGKLLRAFAKESFKRTLAEPCTFKFSVFAGPRATAAQSAELIASVFDDATLTLSAGKSIQCVRDRSIYVITDIIGNLDQNGNQIWQGILYYNILVAPA